ncbi:hypothetical protein KFU94_69960 [Chloroflexi bacterium TSY]|nr:hypothetical protein [Chloroflexi bacterium TSY]
MSTLSELIQQIDDRKAQLDNIRPLSLEAAQRLRAKLNLEWNYHSNAIEGNTLTFQIYSEARTNLCSNGDCISKRLQYLKSIFSQ